MKHLKKLVLLTFVVLTGFACSSDDDSSGSTTAENKAKIIGTWLWTASSENGEDYPLTGCDLMYKLEFNSSQVTETDFYGVDCADSESFTYNYDISGNTITVTVEGETFSSKITTLNSTTLTIKDTEDDDVYIETYTKQ
jgi:hypothetical protein